MNERERAFREYLEQFTDYSEQRIDLAVEWVRYFYREGVQATGESDGSPASSRKGDSAGDRCGDRLCENSQGVEGSASDQASVIFDRAKLPGVDRAILGKSIDGLAGVVRSTRAKRLPVVLNPEEVRARFDAIDEPYTLMCKLMYAAGLRLRECLQIRIADIDFKTEQLAVRGAKGAKDRSALLPAALHQPIETQMAAASRMFTDDIRTVQELLGHSNVNTTMI